MQPDAGTLRHVSARLNLTTLGKVAVERERAPLLSENQDPALAIVVPACGRWPPPPRLDSVVRPDKKSTTEYWAWWPILANPPPWSGIFGTSPLPTIHPSWVPIHNARLGGQHDADVESLQKRPGAATAIRAEILPLT